MATKGNVTRVIFRAYALVAIVLGIIGLDGNLWVALGARLQPAELVLHPSAASPWGAYAVPRIAGCVLVAAGMLALAFGALEDADARRRSLNRFAIAHVVFGFLFSGIASALLDTMLPPVAIWGPLAVGLMLGFFAILQPALRRRGANIDALRSRYEEQIREAARREERARLARDLHDAVKQQLFAIQTGAATVEARLTADHHGALEAAGAVRASAHEAIVEMDALLDQLQAAPMENTGLVEALRKQTEALGFRTGAEVDLMIGDLPPDAALLPGTQDSLYRFAQEALANVGRHARATHVKVFLGQRRGTLELSVQDDGVGFVPGEYHPGMGQRNMADRANELDGRCVFMSTPGSGTTVQCLVPLHWSSLATRALRTGAWVATSAAVGFLLYSCGGQNAQGRSPFLFGFEFLVVFGIALGIAAALAGLWYLWRPRNHAV